MKKLLLSLLLIYPALGFAGGGDREVKPYKVGQIFFVNNEKCIITAAHMDPSSEMPSQILKCRRSILPGILYKNYSVNIPDLSNLEKTYYVESEWNSFSNTAKYIVIGSALTGATYYSASKYFPEQLAEMTKFLSQQKDNLVELISPVATPISETFSPILKPIGDAVSTAAGKISEGFKVLAAFVSSTPSNTSKSFHPKSWGRGIDSILN